MAAERKIKAVVILQVKKITESGLGRIINCGCQVPARHRFALRRAMSRPQLLDVWYVRIEMVMSFFIMHTNFGVEASALPLFYASVFVHEDVTKIQGNVLTGCEALLKDIVQRCANFY